MKSNNIYVGGKLALTSGATAVAVFPPQKGSTVSYMLSDAGKLTLMKGARINGVGVPRFLESQGFRLAPAGDPAAAKLADLIDVEDGCKLVEAASVVQAKNYQAWLAGKTMKLVPFDPEKPVQSVTFKAPPETFCTVFHLDAGLSVAGMRVEYVSLYGDTLDITKGWILGLDEDEANGPRNTEYGGVVERACYLVCNAGLAVLDGHKHLEDGIEEVLDVPFPRGYLRMRVTDAALTTADTLTVGITGVDQLVVVYERDGQEIYRREGLTGVKLGKAIGNIAAALVRVREMDADAAQVKTKKRA